MAADTRPPITGRQQELLLFIARYVADNGYAPAYREICDGTGLSSTSSVGHQLNALEAKGYLRRGSHSSPRALAVVEPLPGQEAA